MNGDALTWTSGIGEDPVGGLYLFSMRVAGGGNPSGLIWNQAGRFKIDPADSKPPGTFFKSIRLIRNHPGRF